VRDADTGFNKKLKGIVTWGDNLYRHYRRKIEEQFHCFVTDTYGCGEGIQVAAQCGLSNGAYHVFMPHVVLEVVDDHGYPVNKGETGNVLLTRLDVGAMPLIRYRVGDLARKALTDTCPCGRGLEMVASIEGRDTDVIVTPNGNRLIVHFFTGIFEYYPSIANFRIVQDRPEHILVEIVPNPDFRIEYFERIKKEILTKGAAELEISLNLVENISQVTSHKRRFVLSHLCGADRPSTNTSETTKA
jgi:phenylacetate-CoA ligase